MRSGMRPVTMPFLPGEGVARELLGATLVAAAFLLVFAVAEGWRRRAGPPVEWSRKLIHICGGVVAGLFPWLFATHWTVFALGLGLVLALRATRARGWLNALHAVERDTKGEFYYPLGVYLLFVVARQEPLFYLIALGALVLADSAAALLGQRYGRVVFTAGNEVKSLEGSVVFFFVAFLGVHLPLSLLTDLPPAATVLVGVQVALLVTSFEAISQQGNDNLVVPLGTYYLLLKLTSQPVADIAYQLAVQVAILILTVLVARGTRFLTLAGAIALHLVLYAAFSLGNPGWIVAPLLALAGCIALDAWFGRASGRPTGGQQVRSVFYLSIVSVLLLFADNTFATLLPASSLLPREHPFFAPFAGALGAQVAIMGFQVLRHRDGGTRRAPMDLGLVASAGAFALVVPLSVLIGPGPEPGPGPPALPSLLTGGALCLLAPPVYLAVRRLVRPPPGAHWDLRIQALAVFLTVALVVPIHLAWVASR